MDDPEPIDPVAPELDTFNLYFPLPYRVLLLFVLGIWAWGLNLQYLQAARIDAAALIKYVNHGASRDPPPHFRVYRLATIATIPVVGSLLFFWIVTGGNEERVKEWEILPQFFLAFLVILFLLPLRHVSRVGRYRFLTTLRRISIGGIAETQDGKFGDILLADALTSYAKVLGDLFVSLCMFISRGESSTAKPNRGCGGLFLVPIILSSPFLIRFRQCLIEYRRVRRSIRSVGYSESTGWGGQHLANALKYATAFPVTILSVMLQAPSTEIDKGSGVGILHLWVFFVLINSLYSFYWDVAKDWDLTMFSSPEERESPDHDWGLRRNLRFRPVNLYYGVVAMDLILRLSWSLKLSPHLVRFNRLEGSVFLIEILEVFRRWVWIFFRVEAEYVRNTRGPQPDDILLGSYDDDHDKYDDD